MTFREFMKENGYEVKTKFWEIGRASCRERV